MAVQCSRREIAPTINSYIKEEMEYAWRYFNEHYNEEINIEDFARSRGMSVGWFLRNFKQVTVKSPRQYIHTLRINNAESLLKTTDYNVAEISTIIGYDDLLCLQEFQSMEHFKQELIAYLDYYNNRRIKAKLKGLPPAIHRQQDLSAA